MGFLIIGGIIFVILLKMQMNIIFVATAFGRGNVLVYGKKRKGKDLLFQYVIYTRHKEYFANIDYGYKYNHIDLKDLSLEPNTYQNLIQGDIIKVKKNLKRERKDTYISDSAIHMPSQYQHLLVKEYPGLPLEYALEGHLYDANIHFFLHLC